MTGSTKNYQKNIVKLLSTVFGLIIIYSVVVGLIFKISAINTIANIALQFFITFLPGLALHAVTRKKQDDWLTVIALSYALGYGFNIVEYFLLMPFGLGNLLKFFAILVSLLSAVILIKKPIHFPPPSLNRWKGVIPAALFCVMVAMDVIIYSGTNASPLLIGSSTYFWDIQYWVNATVGLFLNFPPQAPYLDGFTLYYHYFSNIHVAFSSLVSNIDIFTLSFPLYPLTKSLLLIGGLNYLLDTFKATKWQKALLLTAVYFSTGIERISVVTNFHHFHLVPFGLDISFAFGAYFIASFTERYRESNTPLDWPSFFVTLLYYAVMVGAKAPLAAMLSIYPAVLCITWLLKKKYSYAFTYGAGIAVAFLVISIFCVGMFSAINNLSDTQSMQISPIEKLLTMDQFSSRYLKLFFSIAYKILTAQPLLILLYLLACIKFMVDLFKRRSNEEYISVIIALICTALVSLLFLKIIKHAGTSEMYFMIAAYIPLAALGIYALSHSEQSKYPIIQKVFLAISFLILAVQVYFFAFSAWGGYSAMKSLKDGFANLTETSTNISPDNEFSASSIQRSDVEGLIWIRENTPKDAIIAVDRATYQADASGISYHFYYVMFAERQMYIEGTSMLYVLKDVSDSIIIQRQQLMQALYADPNAAYEKIKVEGIDYVVQTKRITPGFEPGKNFAPVFSTDSLNIYKVK